MRRALLFLLVSAIGINAAEPHACPWMNAASAGGYLGGPVTDTAPCNFVRQDASLTIEIRTGRDLAPYLAKCAAAPVPLKAIGNEAFACTVSGREQAIGRVRDQIFLITLTTNDKPDVRREKVRNAAEQVAGNLY